MRSVRNAIDTFLDSQIVLRETVHTRKKQYAKSKTSSLHSLERLSSYSSSILSFSSCREIPRSDEIIPNGSGMSEAGSSSGLPSSLELALARTTNMETIQIPPSILGPNFMSEEEYWSGLTPNLPTASPAPYSTFKERYLSIFPYLWLHGRLWHGDRATVGTFLVTKYSTQSGKMELLSVRLMSSQPETSYVRYRFTSNYWKTEATLALGDTMLGLSIQSDTAPFDNETLNSPYSFHRLMPSQDKQLSSSSELLIWPPTVFPAEDRTTRAASLSKFSVERPEYSLNLFGLKRKNRLTGSNLELFSALDPQLYTPDIEHPLRGIWYGRTLTGYEFVLFHQRSPNHLESLKLTGNSIVLRGARSFELEITEEEISHGKMYGSNWPVFGWFWRDPSPSPNSNIWIKPLPGAAKMLKCAMERVNSNYLILFRSDDIDLHFRRIDIDQLF